MDFWRLLYEGERYAEEAGGAGSFAGVAAAAAAAAAVAEDVCCSREGSFPVACTAGCGTCCRVTVSILFPEGVAIVSHLDAAGLMTALLPAIRESAKRVRWLEDEERRRAGIACAFLDPQQRCLIHPVRPLACRSITSVDAGACTSAVETGEPISMDLGRKVVFDAIFAALGRGIEAGGRDCRSFELARLVWGLGERRELVDEYLAAKRLRLPG